MNYRLAMPSIALPIADRATSFQFYRALGMQTPGDPVDDGVPEPLIVRVDGLDLILVPVGGFEYVLNGRRAAPSSSSECILSLKADSAPEVDIWHARAISAGAEVISEPKDQPWGYTGLFADPDGHVWEITATQLPPAGQSQ